MGFEDSEETARGLGLGAVAAMEQRGVSLTPSNYRVWYTFMAGSDPDLAKMMNVLISNKVIFTAERNRQIYERFFDAGSAVDDLFTKSSKLESLASQILEQLEEASTDQGAYYDRMNSVSGEISTVADTDSLASMIKTVLAETKKIVARSQHIKESMDESSVEVAALRHNLEVAREEALTDSLTGIGNRKFLDIRLRDEVMVAMESGEPLCVVLADIDHFKKFNDTYGHSIGDEVLKVAASVLKDSVKGRDTAARYGGEEFCIVLPRTVIANAEKLADSIRVTLASQGLSNKKTGRGYGRITMSLGVAMFRPGESIETLVKRADACLYRAKSNGRNHVECEPQADGG